MKAIKTFLRTENTGKLDRQIMYLASLDSGSKSPYSKELVDLLEYFRTIELLVMDVYLKEIRLMPSYYIGDIRLFVEAWAKEELRHGVAIGHLLRIHGHEVKPIQNKPRTVKEYAISARAIGLSWLLFPYAPAAHMIVGAINECTTKSGYRALMKFTDQEDVRLVVSLIQAEEVRHLRYYSDRLNELVTTKRKQEKLEQLLKYAWVPVGSNNADIKQFAKTLLSDITIENEFFQTLKSSLANIQHIVPSIGEIISGDIRALLV